MNNEALERLLIDRDAGELSPDVEDLLEEHLRRDPFARREAAEMSETLRLARLAFAGEPALALPTRQRRQRIDFSVLGVAACVLCAGLVGVFAIRERHESSRSAETTLPRQVAAMPAADESGFWSARRLRSHLASSRAKDTTQVLWTSPITRPELSSK